MLVPDHIPKVKVHLLLAGQSLLAVRPQTLYEN